MKRWLPVILLMLLPLVSNAQTDEAETHNEVTPKKVKQFQPPVFRGLSVHYDLTSPLMGMAYGKVLNFEAQVDVNLYRRLYPIFEVGFASANETTSMGAEYTTHSPFFRVGLNFGLLKPFREDGSERSVRCYPFVGVRYAFSPMNYKIDNVVVSDPYWGTENIVSYGSQLVYSGWLEVVAGVRVDLYKGLTMGWSVRLKTLLHTSAPDKSYLWYVPGFGTTGETAFGFNYMIGYTFYSESFKKKETKK